MTSQAPSFHGRSAVVFASALLLTCSSVTQLSFSPLTLPACRADEPAYECYGCQSRFITAGASSGPPRPQSAACAPQQCDTAPRGGAGARGNPKKTAADQIVFDTSVSPSPTVGIIGGGLSGVALAAELSDRGIRSVVYDTGEHGVGGRLGTRDKLGKDGRLRFDHAAQYFTVERHADRRRPPALSACAPRHSRLRRGVAPPPPVSGASRLLSALLIISPFPQNAQPGLCGAGGQVGSGRGRRGVDRTRGHRPPEREIRGPPRGASEIASHPLFHHPNPQ